MYSRSIYVNSLFKAIQDDGLSLEIRVRQAQTAIKAILAVKPIHEEFKRANPSLKIELEDEVDVNVTHKGATPLICAIYKGYTNIVTLLLSEKADPNIQDEKTLTFPLALAAHSGHTQMVIALLDAKADPNQPNGVLKLLPLALAAKMGFTEIVSLLLDAKADLERVDLQEKTAFEYSLTEKKLSTVALLLKNQAKVRDLSQLQNFLATENQSDPDTFEVIKIYRDLQVEPLSPTLTTYFDKLAQLHKDYRLLAANFFTDTGLSQDLIMLIFMYSFFEPKHLPPIEFLKTHTIDVHLKESKSHTQTLISKKELKEKNGKPGFFNKFTFISENVPKFPTKKI
jgi:hypothetical protein